MWKNWKEVLLTELRFLCLLPARPDLTRLGNHYLALALGTSWMAGLGRYWDHPKAEWWQYAGLGSVAYVFVLALILWLLFKPLKPAHWSYRGVLTFVGMTSPPALLYAIPVERYVDLHTAQSINVWFLAVVAAWRVILLALYLRRAGGLDWHTTLVAVPLPLALIVATLASLNLEHVVFRVMAGLREDERSPHDAAYGVLLALTYLSVLLSPFLLMFYASNIYHRQSELKKAEKRARAEARANAQATED
jgi:hypothetical protein